MNGESFNGLDAYESMPLVEWEQLYDVYVAVQAMKREEMERNRKK